MEFHLVLARRTVTSHSREEMLVHTSVAIDRSENLVYKLDTAMPVFQTMSRRLEENCCPALSHGAQDDILSLCCTWLATVPKPFPNAADNRAQCSGQIDRMVRVLSSKGVTDRLYDLCAQQAAGQPIKAPAAAK
jgi:hypothetical protein